MTTNPGLRTELISIVHNGTIASKDTNPAFAVSYNTANGTPLQEVARWVNFEILS